MDANYCFVLIDVGAYGRNSDGGTFSNSLFGRALDEGSLILPAANYLPNIGLVPHVLVGDEAFPLKTYMMRPYPGRGLTHDERIFNYRLSRARRIVENAFGILAVKWRIYHRTMEQTPETVDETVKATCVLHNFLRLKVLESGDHDEDLEMIENTNRRRNDGDTNDTNALLQLHKTKGGSSSREAFHIRDLFRDYFVTQIGSVPWQETVFQV